MIFDELMLDFAMITFFYQSLNAEYSAAVNSGPTLLPILLDG
jgi:hypothetical protein